MNKIYPLFLFNTALWNPDKFGYVCPMGTGYFPASITEIATNQQQIIKNPALIQFKLFMIGRGKTTILPPKTIKPC